MASEQGPPNVDNNDHSSVSDSAETSVQETTTPDPVSETGSRPLGDFVREGQQIAIDGIAKGLEGLNFESVSSASKDFRPAAINPSGHDLSEGRTTYPVQVKPKQLEALTKTNTEAEQKQNDAVQNPSDHTFESSVHDQLQSLRKDFVKLRSDHEELKKSVNGKSETTAAAAKVMRTKLEELESRIQQNAKVSATERISAMEDQIRILQEFFVVITEQTKDLLKATGLSPDKSVEEAWKEFLSQGADSESDPFEPGEFLQVDPSIISYECSTRSNGKALIYVRKSFEGLFESIMSVHNAHQVQTNQPNTDPATTQLQATQDRMESNTATGSITATDQTNPMAATATEKWTSELPASTTTAAATQISKDTDEPNLITGASTKTPPVTGPGNHYLVTGTPGTGKSCFVYFLLHHLLAKEGDSVLYQNCHIKMKCFVVITRLEGNNYDVTSHQTLSNGIPKPSHGFLGKGENSVSKVKPVSWYIFDSGHKSGAKPESTDVPTIVISSPDCDQYKDFMQMCPEKFYMPTWEWPEICAVVNQFHPDRSKEMTREYHSEALFKQLALAHEAFFKHGGVIREILNPYSEGRLVALHKAIDRSDVNRVLQFLQARGDVSSAVSHRVLHQKCDKKLENGRVDYQNPSIGFASDYVFDRFWAEHLQKKADITLEQLSQMYELVPADAKSIRRTKFGHKFEELVHRTLESGNHYGKPLKSRKNPKSKSFKLTFNSKVERESCYDPSTASIICTIDIKDGDNTAYVFPSSPTFPAIDAFLPGQKYLIQVTIAENHPVAVPELLAFISSCKWQPKDTTLVFVVLDQIYESFEYQMPKNPNKLLQKQSTDFSKIKQFALPMPMLPRQLPDEQ